MLTLLWWGHDTHAGTCKIDHPENWEDWRLAVEDVWYALDSIIAHGVTQPKGTGKRKHVEVEGAEVRSESPSHRQTRRRVTAQGSAEKA
jgi:hypothetical protein